MSEQTGWRTRLLNDDGLFSEKEPDDLYELDDEDFDDGKGLDYWETYELEGDQLPLTFLERHEWSSGKWSERPVSARSGPSREQRSVTLRAVAGEPTFELEGCEFYPIAECPAAEASREFLAESLAECRRRAARR